MGLEKQKARHAFGLQDLGLVEGPILRGAGTVLTLLNEVVAASASCLLIFDDMSGTLVARMCHGHLFSRSKLPLSNSVASMIREDNNTYATSDLARDFPGSVEAEHFDARAFMATPVYGPETEPLGVLAAINYGQHDWSRLEQDKLDSLAHLVSQEIVLRASLETLRIMSKERLRTV